MRILLIQILLLFIALFSSGEDFKIYVENETSFLFYRENNESKGFYSELFKKIGEDTNIGLDLLPLNPQIILDFEKNDKNIIMDLIETEEREKKFNFIPTFFKLNSKIYFLDKSIKSIDNFKHRKVGLLENYYITKEFKEKYTHIDYIPVQIKSRQEGIELLKDGKIDAFVADNQYGMEIKTESLDLTRIPTVSTNLAIPKSNEKLYYILKDYITKIPHEDLKKLINDARVNYYQYKFKDKYKDLEGKKLRVLLPSGNDYYPLYYKNNDVGDGIGINYLRDIEKILKVKIDYVILKDISKISDDIDMTLVNRETDLTKEKFNFSNSYYNFTVSVFNKMEDGFISEVEELYGKRVVVSKSESYEKSTLKSNMDIDYLVVDNLQEALEKVVTGEADFGLGDEKAIINKAFNLKNNKIKIAGNTNKKIEIGFGINKNNPLLYNAIQEISESFLNGNLAVNLYLNKNHKEDKNYSTLFLIFLIGIIIMVLFRNYKLKKSERRYYDLTMSLVGSLEAASSYNDEDTGEHIRRVCLYSKYLAMKLGLSSKNVEEIGNFASLHDIGKIGIDHNILRKPGKLTNQEFEVMKNHTKIGFQILQKSSLGKVAENIALYHHEKWNGNGYPTGLAHEAIPIEARIVAVADVYDALRQERSYKVAKSHEEALKIIVEEIGISFDPRIVRLFLESQSTFEEIYNLNK
ncbi:MAG: transporter substrate-binding domain-containing protein [Cetobacterium sp.]